MGNAPFKMKGSPFQRNFNIGETEAPKKDTPTKAETPELTDEQKKQMRAVELSKKYEDEPGFKEYRDKVFGGETTVEGSVSTVTKPTPPIEEED